MGDTVVKYHTNLSIVGLEPRLGDVNNIKLFLYTTYFLFSSVYLVTSTNNKISYFANKKQFIDILWRHFVHFLLSYI